jgi:hypothetical protein
MRGFIMGMKTIKTNDKMIGLNLNPKHTQKKKDQNKNTKVKTKK